jgi:glycosyltransferase involved in cell wall biosynthesis
MKIIQINVTANSCSTGRIAEGIGLKAQKAGFDSWIAYGRWANNSSSHLIRIGTKIDYLEHGIETRLFDNHGLASRRATGSFLKKIDTIKPDIIHLHNIHGYYLNYKLLFQYIRKKGIPVVWTLHDCWAFTGHCSHFSFCRCEKWRSGCFSCSQKRSYPLSLFLDRSKNNYEDKKKNFTSISNLTIVSVSEWLENLVSQSFLGGSNHVVIHNGIDTAMFSPASQSNEIRLKHGIRQNEMMLLGVAGVWDKRKGLHDFIELSKHLPPQQKIVLVGLTGKQIKTLPKTIIGIERTESTKQLSEYYSAANLFLNLTYEDNYPTTNLEAISCGTPCLTYKTGGSPESITAETGFIVSQGNLESVQQCINTVQKNGKESYSSACRKYSLAHFRQEDCFNNYIKIYEALLKKQ